MEKIAINADVGEGFGAWTFGDDEALLDVITAANVACGFHGGDPTIMRRTCAVAAERGVSIGAQVSYRDLAGFGRRFIDVPVGELVNEIIYQVSALAGIAAVEGARVEFVKPHGALYNAAASHEGHATAVASAVAQLDPSLPLLCLPGTVMARVATEHGLTVLAEAFADRAYTPSGLLVPRSEPGAVVSDADEVVRRVVQIATTGTVGAIDGTLVELPGIDALCVHSDTPGAGSLAARVRRALEEAGVDVVGLGA